MRNVFLGIAAVGVLLGVVAVAPALVPREVEHYEWRGAIGTAELSSPIGIAYGNARLYVTDAVDQRIVVFDTSGTVVAEWGDSLVGLERPMHLSLGSDGHLRVAEYLSDRVAVIDPTGAVVERVGGATGSGPGELDAPGGVALLGDDLYVADFYNHRVQTFSKGATRAIGAPGRAFRGRLHYPTDVAVSDSLVYVADAYNHRIQVFRPNGEYVRAWGGPLGLGIPGPFRGWFKVATGIEVARGRVYVADFFNDRIQIFSEGGRYLAQVADSLSLPTDVAIGESGALYVVDFGHKRIVRLARSSRAH